MATKHKDPVFTGMPTPRKFRFVTFWIITGMLTLTVLLHYTEPGQSIYERITGAADSSSNSRPTESGRPATDGWDELLNQGAR